MIRLPASRVPDPALAPSLGWGILGTGWIAARFVDALTRLGPHRVEAVGSRSPETARDFAARHGIGRPYGSYPDLVDDPAVDVVYIATPHTHHLPHARLALEAAKHVLVEKPIGLDGGTTVWSTRWPGRSPPARPRPRCGRWRTRWRRSR